jgi:hypothetical protein
MTPRKPILAMFATLLLIVAVELGLDAWFAAPPPLRGLPPEDCDPLYFLLGSSRTQCAFEPSHMEAVLREHGVPAPFVVNLSQDGTTNLTMFDNYMNEVRPLVRDLGRRVVVAIEARPSGMNDSYANATETQKWVRGEYTKHFATARAHDGIARQLAAFDFGAAAKTIFSFTALANGAETVRRIERRIDSAESPYWAKGVKGYAPYQTARHEDLDVATWRFHFQNVILRNFSFERTFGNMQFRIFTLLAQRAREDGCDVVLYMLPTTAVHKSFWPEGQRDRVVEAIQRFAADEGFPLIDYDVGHTVPDSDFHDTHHLAAHGGRKLAERFAREVFLPRAK